MAFDLNNSVTRGVDVNQTTRDTHITANNFEIQLGDAYGLTTFNVLNQVTTPVVSMNSDGYLGINGNFFVNGQNIINTPYITMVDNTTNVSASIFLVNQNPNGVIVGTKGSIALNTQDGYCYSNFDGVTNWQRYATIKEVGGGGSGNSKQKLVEVDFGPDTIYENTFTIYDPDVYTTSNIAVTMSGIQPTGKDADEVFMDSYSLLAYPDTVTNGIFYIYIRGLEGFLADKFKVVYSIG